MKHQIVKAHEVGIGHRILMPQNKQMVVYEVVPFNGTIEFDSAFGQVYIVAKNADVTIINRSNQNKKRRTV